MVAIRHLLSAAALALVLAAPAHAQASPDASVEAPDYGPFGIQLDNLDPAVDPGDDFDAHVSEKWRKANPIPADRTEYGGFIMLRDLSENRMRRILEEVVASNPQPGTPAAMLAASYAAFIDTGRIEAAGLTTAAPTLARIRAAKTPEELVALFADPSLASPVSLSVTVDAKDSERYALYAGQARLGLPDRDYYLVDSPRNREIAAKYRDYLATILGEAGYADPRAAADAVYSLETKMAAANWDRALGRNRDLTYNKLSIDAFAALAPQVPLRALVEQAGGAAAREIVVTQLPPTPEELAAANYTPEMAAKLGGGVPALAALIASEPVASWQAWLISRFLTNNADVLPKRIDDAQFAFYGTVLNGQPEQRARWKRAIAQVEGQVGELAGEIYAARYFPPASKARMDELVANLRKAMAANLKDLKWMSPATRGEAQAKLDAFTPKIGYPEKYETYPGLALSAETALANEIAAQRWDRADDMAKIGQPVDKTEWSMFPQTVNAYYSSTRNEIVFPAAILQPPFFGLTADDAVNYGAIGGVIGHEIGHGFDDQGSKSDGAGNLRNWWTPEDRKAFEVLTARLVAQYDGFCPFDGGKTCVNGRLTLGENIGDIGGLSLAYRAYKLSLNGKEAPVLGGLTGDQRFFIGWAQAFRSATREAAARQQLITDPHSPDQYRVNGVVRNFDEWYKAFNVAPDDALYLPPDQRIRIW